MTNLPSVCGTLWNNRCREESKKLRRQRTKAPGPPLTPTPGRDVRRRRSRKLPSAFIARVSGTAHAARPPWPVPSLSTAEPTAVYRVRTAFSAETLTTARRGHYAVRKRC